MQLKFEKLEATNSENVAKLALLEVMNVKQEEEIIHLKTKFDAKLESNLVSPDKRVPHSTELESEYLRGPINDAPVLNAVENHIKRNLIVNKKEKHSDDSSTRATVPSSCRELSLIGHSLDGVYLVKNVDTNKLQAAYYDFGSSGKVY